MEKKSLNVVIFDDEEQSNPKNDIKKHVNPATTKSSSINTVSSPQKYVSKLPETDKLAVISKQISQLHLKIKNLEKDSQKIRYELQKPSKFNSSSDETMRFPPTKINEIEHILMVVERKIQLILRQSKKIITKMNESVNKKLNQLQKKQSYQNQNQNHDQNKNINKINQVQTILRQKLQNYEKHYRNEYDKFVKQTKKKEQTLIKKLAEIESKFNAKAESFQTKQKQYIDWIHHLQAKLKARKNKKMICVTQQKSQVSPANSQTSSAMNQYQNNHPHQAVSSHRNSKINNSLDQNNSKIIRKHKIFEKKPANSVPKNINALPTKDSLISPQIQNSEYYQHKFNAQSQNLNFYNDFKREEATKEKYKTPQYQEGWDKFADFKDLNDDNTEYQTEDFFSPINPGQVHETILENIRFDNRGISSGRPIQNYVSYQKTIEFQFNGQKAKSPFDLN